MQLKLKRSALYNRTIAKLSVLLILSCFGCMLFGYLFMPFASALYAALLIYEEKKKIFSVALPILLLIVNFLINGLYSLECVSYALVGLVIFFCIKRRLSKGETAFWVILLTVLCFVSSALFIAFGKEWGVGANAIKGFYQNLYGVLKDAALDFLTSLTTLDEKGLLVFAYNAIEAEAFIRETVLLLIPMAFILAFLSAGVTFKFFASVVEKNSGEECGIHFWKFKTSNLIAYFYIIIAILSIFAINDGTVFTYAITTLNTIFAPVFAYIGAYVIYLFLIARGKTPIFSILILSLGILVLSFFSVQILSFLGVYFNIKSNKLSRKLK